MFKAAQVVRFGARKSRVLELFRIGAFNSSNLNTLHDFSGSVFEHLQNLSFDNILS